MKIFSHSINIDKDKNYVISHTESDWASMRKDSLISIDTDKHFYTIGNIEELNFITDFNIQNNQLIISGNFEHYFLRDDILTISYKEYELLMIKSIINSGNGYKIGDILSCSGGQLSINVFDNSKNATTFQIEEINGNGGISKLKILNKGTYINTPEENNTLSGGSGNSAVIALGFIIINNRRMLERQVINATNNQSNTILELNGNLPIGVTNGKISMAKYIGYLTSNYVGNSKRNCKYTIIRDRTPHLGLPLLLKNSDKTEEFFNYTLLELDKRIKNLEDKLLKAEL